MKKLLPFILAIFILAASIVPAFAEDLTLELSTGESFVVPSAAANAWNDYNFHMVVYSSNSGSYYVYLFNDIDSIYCSQRSSFGELVWAWNLLKPYAKVSDNVLEESLWDDSGYVSNVRWTDFPLKALSDGTVIRPSDVETPEPEPEPSVFKVTFVTGIDGYTIPDGSSQSFALPTFSYTGYTFDGWYLDPDFVYPYTSSYEFSADTILYAKSYKTPVVSFVTGYDDLTYEDQYADALNLPRPSRSDLVFVGWYLDAEFTQPFSIGSRITEDITLYAKWTDALPMGFFTGVIFSSLTTFFECQPVLYLMSLMALCVIVGILKDFFVSRA